MGRTPLRPDRAHQGQARGNARAGPCTEHSHQRAEIGDHLALARRSHVGAGLLDDADNLIAWREWQGSLEVRIAPAPDHRVGEASAGGEHLNADLAGAGIGNVGLVGQFQDLGATKPGDTDILPRHEFTRIGGHACQIVWEPVKLPVGCALFVQFR